MISTIDRFTGVYGPSKVHRKVNYINKSPSTERTTRPWSTKYFAVSHSVGLEHGRPRLFQWWITTELAKNISIYFLHVVALYWNLAYILVYILNNDVRVFFLSETSLSSVHVSHFFSSKFARKYEIRPPLCTPEAVFACRFSFDFLGPQPFLLGLACLFRRLTGHAALAQGCFQSFPTVSRSLCMLKETEEIISWPRRPSLKC